MWDGRANELQSALTIPLESTEMAIDWSRSIDQLKIDPVVLEIDPKLGSDLDRDTILKSLTQYVETLDAYRSRFDRFYFDNDKSALSEREQLGFRLFTHKAHCSSCHLVDGTSAPFTDSSFHRTGLTRLSGDRGRAEITGDSHDEGAFKTPSLRGVTLRPLLMHDGSITDLREVIERYNRAEASEADPRIKPLFLDRQEIDAIVGFLQALSPISGARR